MVQRAIPTTSPWWSLSGRDEVQKGVQAREDEFRGGSFEQASRATRCGILVGDSHEPGSSSRTIPFALRIKNRIPSNWVLLIPLYTAPPPRSSDPAFLARAQ